jgi:GGDEF domain-containing protein
VQRFRQHSHAVGPQRFWVTVAIGVATRDARHPFAEAQALLRAAGRALYAAKHQGRDCGVTFHDRLLASVRVVSACEVEHAVVS